MISKVANVPLTGMGEGNSSPFAALISKKFTFEMPDPEFAPQLIMTNILEARSSSLRINGKFWDSDR